MCVLIACRNKLDKDTFERCFNKNKDGFGFAWKEGENVRYIKGLMELDNAWEEYNEHNFERLFDGTNYTHVAHFRLGSPVCPELTHPFIISKTSAETINYTGRDRVLFHNGTITGWKDNLIAMYLKIGQIPKGKMSDTRWASIMISILGDDFLNVVNGKFIILGPNYMVIHGDFEEHNGNKFSNDSYKKMIVPATYSYYNKHKPELNKTYEDLEDVQEFVI